MIKLYNGRVITPSGIINNGTVLVEGDKIVEVTASNIETPVDGEAIDCGGNCVAPGLIDIHCHGGGGYDFMDATVEAFRSIMETHARYGMTSIYATTACCSNETIYKVLNTYEQMKEVDHKGCNLLGVHLEGNCLNPKYKGGQNPEFLMTPDEAEYRPIAEYGSGVKRWSISPELPGALEMGRYLSRRGILPSIAHSDADHETMKAAVSSGFTHVTHLYNAMSGIHKNREFKRAGVVESCYLLDELSVEIIADGVHNPVELLLFVHKFKGVERTALITDAMACAGVEGMTSYYDGRVIIEDGVGKLADRSALASSIATADRLVRVMTQQAGIPLIDAVRMGAETPARIMGVADRKGSIQKGKDADIIVFNNNIDILRTMVGGKSVYVR